MPPLETFRLTKELVQRVVKDNTVIVTSSNYAYMDFILTWVKHLTDLGLTNFLIGDYILFCVVCHIQRVFFICYFLTVLLIRIHKITLESILLGATDAELLQALYWKGLPVFDMGIHLSEENIRWGSASFHKLMREKVFLINSMLPFGFEVLMCDTDVIWLKVFFSISKFLFSSLPKLC